MKHQENNCSTYKKVTKAYTNKKINKVKKQTEFKNKETIKWTEKTKLQEKVLAYP